jgi:putative ABC transport system permease protein
LDRKALRELVTMKSQTFTIALVAACGVAILVSFLSAYDSLTGAVDGFYRSSRFADAFAVVKRAPNTLLGSIRDLDGVDLLEARIVYDATLSIPGQAEGATGRFVSIPDAVPQLLNKIHINRGRLPEPYSLNEVVISEAFAKANGLKPGSEIYGIVNGRYRKFLIVGIGLSPEYVYAFRGQSPLPDDKHFGVVWLTEKTLSEILDFKGAWNSISFTVQGGYSVRDVIKSIDPILLNYGGAGAFERKDHPSHFFLNSELNELRVMVVVLPVIFLGVASFLLNVVIARLISRQREQIATLKALGYGNFTIGLHYMKIVSIIILLGSIPGILPGIWLGHAMTVLYGDYFRFPSLDYVFQAYVPMVGVAASVLAALLGALHSMGEVVRLAPAEAMRPPAPPIFHRSLIERIIGVMKPVTKMAVRNFTLKPVRSALSALGLSLALAIILIGLFWNDTIDFLLGFQFNNAQHEDATVSFHRPILAASVNELNGLPGVLYSEGYRIVPVRLINGSLIENMALFGIPEGARLKRLMDEDMKPVMLPPEGILLNVRTAEKLGVHEGQSLTVELLEGERRSVRVVVASTVEELLGSGAYMEIRSLNRLMKEDAVISMASLSIDFRLADTLYTRLRAMPYVATIDTKNAMLAAFQLMVAELLLLMAFFIVGFACVIAVGVVYNMVMVALSERSWELASLRVLGFTRAEVFRVLIGEIVIQILVSLPLGTLLGFGILKLLLALVAEKIEAFYFPLVIVPSSVATAIFVILIAALFSALLVWRKIQKLDLVAVLKLRE